MNLVLIDVDAGVAVADRETYCSAQNRQVAEHFSPAWGVGGVMRVADAGPPGFVRIQLEDQPTLSGAGGFHACSPDGTPIAHVFVGLAKKLGVRWETIASHEVLELLADPYLHRSVQLPDGFWDLEVCDRVEQDFYLIDGVPVSNFNLPACFEPPRNLAGVRFDHMGLSVHPNEVRPGGYAQHFDPTRGGWVQDGTLSAYRSQLAALGISRNLQRQAGLLRPEWLPSI